MCFWVIKVKQQINSGSDGFTFIFTAEWSFDLFLLSLWQRHISSHKVWQIFRVLSLNPNYKSESSHVSLNSFYSAKSYKSVLKQLQSLIKKKESKKHWYNKELGDEANVLKIESRTKNNHKSTREQKANESVSNIHTLFGKKTPFLSVLWPKYLTPPTISALPVERTKTQEYNIHKQTICKMTKTVIEYWI